MGTSDRVELTEPVEIRFICHALLQAIPDGALMEAAESLYEVYEFHSLPRLSHKKVPLVTTAPATLGATYVRPVFPVTEE